MTKREALTASPATTNSAWPKSAWASSGPCSIGRKTWAFRCRQARTASPTTLGPPR